MRVLMSLSPTSSSALLGSCLPTSCKAQFGSLSSSLEAVPSSHRGGHLPPRCLFYHYPQFHLLLHAIPHAHNTAHRPISSDHELAAVMTAYLVASPSLKIIQEHLKLFHETWSLMGNLLLPPLATSVGQPPVTRPPAEPPPQFREGEQNGSITTPILLLLKLGKPFLPTALLASVRPPWKPPWNRHDSHLAWFPIVLVSFLHSGFSMGKFFEIFCVSMFWLKDASQLFAESPHRNFGCPSTWLWTLFLYVVTVKAFWTDTHCNAASNYHLVSVSWHKAANQETNNSRMERTLGMEATVNLDDLSYLGCLCPYDF